MKWIKRKVSLKDESCSPEHKFLLPRESKSDFSKVKKVHSTLCWPSSPPLTSRIIWMAPPLQEFLLQNKYSGGLSASCLLLVSSFAIKTKTQSYKLEIKKWQKKWLFCDMLHCLAIKTHTNFCYKHASFLFQNYRKTLTA